MTGTIFTQGSIKGYYRCYHEALTEVGVHLDPAEEDRRIQAKWGAGHRKQLEHLMQEYPDRVDAAVGIYQKHLFGNTFVDCLTVIDGAQEFLKDIARRYTLAVATGAHPKILKERLFPAFDIPEVFAQVMTIYDTDNPAHAKPHPFIAKQIMQTQGIAPKETVLVGDAATDMQMAWNAGIEPIAVLTGHMDRAQAKKLGVKHIIDNVTLLESELQKL